MARVLNRRHDRIPPGAVYVGRPSKWGNPYRIGWIEWAITFELGIIAGLIIADIIHLLVR